MEMYTNDLINESSPYLLQHAHNPVNWVAWSDDVFEIAKKENKLVLVSVGYSACHWCHVMEHECFEDEEVATLMNKFFINVKVDREERPDVDQLYMTAVQLMTQKGGWPLNCFTLPDGRPIYGGTYFPKEQWMHVLKSLVHTFQNDLEKVEDYAEKLHEGIIASELIDAPQTIETFEASHLEELILRWKKSFDPNYGGNSRAPKFPLPNNLLFLQNYGFVTKNEGLLKHVDLTLQKMAFGGIYDQIGGGFSRYSVDLLWKVPHFEKMLYDNAQLIQVYALAYQRTKNPLYEEIVQQTHLWLENEMLSEYGCFYSALDADSEGEEGKFYVWTEEELMALIGEDFRWVKSYYNVNDLGAWEGNFILMRNQSDEDFAKQMSWPVDELKEKVKKINDLLLAERNHRIRPGLDDKSLTSWNAMLMTGYLHAYQVFQKEEYLQRAQQIRYWIEKYQWKEEKELFRNFKNGKANIPAFLEDYAHLIEAYLQFFIVEEKIVYLEKAEKLTRFVIENFMHSESNMFYFTPADSKLIARKMEINDNVIPASNSVMAQNLQQLGILLRNENYLNLSKQMLANVYDGMEQYGSGYSNWADLLTRICYGTNEIISINSSYKENKEKFNQHFMPYTYFLEYQKELEITKEKEAKGDKQGFYWCKGTTCYAPETEFNVFLEKILNEQ